MMREQKEGLVAATLKAMGAIGRRNAVTRTEVARCLGMDTAEVKRTVSRLLERERPDGTICSSGSGLFIPEDSEEGDMEVAAYIAFVTKKAAGAFRSLAGARKYIAQRQRQKSGQTQLDLTEVTEEDEQPEKNVPEENL